MCPTFGRSSLLCFYKRGIIFFIPNKLSGRNVQIISRNPTNSVKVNKFISKDKNIEALEDKENYHNLDEH